MSGVSPCLETERNAVDKTNTAVVLVNPKTAFNVGSVLRACSIFGVGVLRWTGQRVQVHKAKDTVGPPGERLPREERMKDYTWVDWRRTDSDTLITSFVCQGYTPVCVEVDDTAEYLDEFVHPHKAVYVFGPEDGGVPKGVRTVCHRFVRIRTANRSPLNLAAAVNVVLHDRFVKQSREGDGDENH